MVGNVPTKSNENWISISQEKYAEWVFLAPSPFPKPYNRPQ